MKTVTEIPPKMYNLFKLLNKEYEWSEFTESDIIIKYYCYDDRCKWDTFIVTCDNDSIYGGVFGFLNMLPIDYKKEKI